ncbi:MarR family winged helix-turn-helix transcriptional regulator [Vallitalea okinawensis]|uniref:MarR family winged helix-turn-helix transcriptional regulator n=1 Tax=Vallitalea okinawensis TaxID=2078660 RepID=UPI000CFC61E4|nr:MarR family transcriptional regulator [Vallitalea okinawensis]
MREIDISSIFELNYIIENTFFSKLKDKFDFPDEIKDTHIKALIIINEGNKITMSQVSQKLNLVKGAFTPVANRLINFGFVEKMRCEEDKRVSYLSLTQAGSDFVTDLMGIITDDILNKINKLSDDEQEAYFAAIKFIVSTTKKIMD